MQLSLGRRGFLTGVAAAAAFLAGPAEAAPARRWRVATGNRILTPASLAGAGVAFAGDAAVGLVSGDYGELAWRVELPEGEPARFRPRVGDGRLITGGDTALAAWDMEDGRLLWRVRPEFGFGTPLLSGGRLYCGDGHRLVALDAATGAVDWRFDAIADTQVSYAPAATGDLVLVGPGDGRLYALTAADGRLAWRVDRSADWQYLRQLHVWGNVLVAGAYQEKLHGLDVADGHEIWSFYAGNFINSHLVADGAAYLWSPTGWLYAVDAAAGRVRWRHRTTDYGAGTRNWAPLMAELATQGRRLFALDMADVLHILDTETGFEQARVVIGQRLRPFVLPMGAGTVVVGGVDGTLSALVV